MHKKAGRVVFVRHGQSIWNITDPKKGYTSRFTGWVDIEMTALGVQQARAAGDCLTTFMIKPHAVYTSLLKRSKNSLKEMNILSRLENEGFETTLINSWRLNERHYGKLTGLPKDDVGRIFGDEEVTQWRKSWDKAPPPLHHEDLMDLSIAISAQPTTIITSPHKSRIVATEKNISTPSTESMKDCARRALPLWHNSIAPRVARGETVLVVAHANSIRSLLKCIDDDTITDETIRNISIPSAIPLIYDFDINDGAVQKFSFSSGQCVLDYEGILKPIGIPSRLGVRGRYVLNKSLIKLYIESLKGNDISEQLPESPFYDLADKGLNELISYCDEGAGKKVAMVITDGKGYIIHVNESWVSLTGFSKEEVVGKSNSFLLGPLSDKTILRDMNEDLLTGLPVSTKIVNYQKNGTPFVNNFTIIPVYDWKNRVSSADNKSPIDDLNTIPSYFIAKLFRPLK